MSKKSSIFCKVCGKSLNSGKIFCSFNCYGNYRKSIAKENRIYQINEEYFNQIDSPDKAYWLGFIAADGCVHDEKRRKVLTFNIQIRDKDLLKQLVEDLESTHPVKINSHGQASLRIHNTKLCEDLEKHGICQRKSLVLKFPKLSNRLYSHFVRGYFDGDGCAYVKKGHKHSPNYVRIIVNFAGTSIFLEELKDLLEKVNLSDARNHVLQIRLGTPAMQLSYEGEKAIAIRDWMYSDATRFLARKKDKLFEEYQALLNKK